MGFELLKKLQKIMLFMIIICVPLNNLPKAFTLPGLGGTLSNYFVLVAILMLLYEYLKFGFEINKKVIKFFTVFILWQLVCLIIGLATYEYNELLSLEQIPKLNTVVHFFSDFEIRVNELLAIKAWLFLRFSKDILFTNNVIFFVTFYIYHLYKANFDAAYKDVRKAVMCLVLIMGAYSFIELLWLKLGLKFAEDFLINFNSLLYEPKSSHGWWPPLLWNNQLRSICSEPSFFGTISILCLPFLWSLLFESKNKFLSGILIFYFSLMIVATNSRTAIILTIVTIILLGIITIINRTMLKQVLIICCVSVMAFTVNLIDYRQLLNYGKLTMLTAEKYLEQNVVSITESNVRSNSARFANLIANLKTIKQHPILGVGTGLKDAYIDSNLPEFAFSNSEVRNWSQYMHNEGILKSGYPSLNKFADVCVANGIIGFVLYFTPLIYLSLKLLKNNQKILGCNYTLLLIIEMIALLGAMFSGSALIICNGIVWGLLLCKIKSMKN